MTSEREQLWQKHVTEWQASGLSGMAYCKQQSLTYCGLFIGARSWPV
jgi:hypothetical protein